MSKDKICVALSCGVGFTSILVLLLNIKSSLTSLGILALLAPGGLLAAIVSKSDGLGSPLVLMAGNSIAYAFIAYILIYYIYSVLPPVTVRRVGLRLALLAAILFALACIPTFSPLWPRGMAQLKKQESDLQAALPLGMEVSQSRAILVSRGIQFREEIEPSRNIVLERLGRKLVAAEGDRILSARFETSASAFPCGYDLEIVLLFGQDNKLKEQYVSRLRVCP